MSGHKTNLPVPAKPYKVTCYPTNTKVRLETPNHTFEGTLRIWDDPHCGHYPYRVVRVAPSLFHVKPIAWSFQVDEPPVFEQQLSEEMAYCALLNLSTCVVLSPIECFYIEPDGSIQFSNRPPKGGTVVEQVIATEGQETAS